MFEYHPSADRPVKVVLLTGALAELNEALAAWPRATPTSPSALTP